MKKVPCSYEGCKHYRIHHERPHEARGVVWVEVPDDHEGKAYCSITCAVLDGAMKLKVEPKDQSIDPQST